MASFGKAMAWGCAALLALAGAAEAQKQGGVLRIPNLDSPASMSILEEATVISEGPMMPVFNNLVLFDQHVAKNSLDTIVPELATKWAWNDDQTALTFTLREGVKWHDGKPFTARDVQCTWDLLTGKSAEKLRVNPRKSWYRNLDSVSVNGDSEVTFHLKRPQPSFIALLASGWSPVYPCHVTPAQMRQHPIGTGPFKFVEFKPNEVIKVARNPDYWKPGLPYLDGIEYQIIRNTSTAVLALVAGKLDRTWPGIVPITLMKEIKSQAPQIQCNIYPWNIPRMLLVNRDKPPFDNPELRRAIGLALDRKAFIDTLSEGQGDIGGTMLPPPDGAWGVPPDMLKTFPGYDPDVEKNRAEARKIMEKLGYGPNNRLAFPLTSRNNLAYRDPAVLLIDQLKSIYIDATLDLDRYDAMVSARFAQRLRRRADGRGKRPRRSRPAILRKLRLRRRTQLHRLLRPGGGQNGGPAIRRTRCRKAPQAGVGDRTQARRRRRPAGDLLPALGLLHLSRRQEPDDHRQQQLQRLAF